VTDQAHRYRGRGELSAMAVGAGFVTREARRRGVIGAFVTRRAGERAMTCARVEKLGVVSFRTLGREGHGRTQKPQTQQSKSNHLIALRLSGGRWAIR
jgi:hypothetical protein